MRHGRQTATLDVRVSASTDDAEERATGIVSLASSNLELVFDSGGDQIVGMRFNGITIPPNATITNVFVQFQADEGNSVATSLTIEGEATDNAPTFVNSNGNISSRQPRTVAVAWSPVPWDVVGASQQTPSIASVIQEIVARPGWVSGNSIVIIISGTGERTAESFNGDQAAAPLIHIEYN